MLLRTQIAQFNNSHCYLFLNNLEMWTNALRVVVSGKSACQQMLLLVDYITGFLLKVQAGQGLNAHLWPLRLAQISSKQKTHPIQVKVSGEFFRTWGDGVEHFINSVQKDLLHKHEVSNC